MRPGAVVCVVDDEAPIRRLIRAQLESEGVTVVEAKSSDEAQAAIEEHLASLAIIDLFMQRGDGLSLIATLKHNWPRLRILAISGGGGGRAIDYLKVARDLGADDTLAKPFSREEIVAKVRDLLNG